MVPQEPLATVKTSEDEDSHPIIGRACVQAREAAERPELDGASCRFEDTRPLKKVEHVSNLRGSHHREALIVSPDKECTVQHEAVDWNQVADNDDSRTTLVSSDDDGSVGSLTSDQGHDDSKRSDEVEKVKDDRSSTSKADAEEEADAEGREDLDACGTDKEYGTDNVNSAEEDTCGIIEILLNRDHVHSVHDDYSYRTSLDDEVLNAPTSPVEKRNIIENASPPGSFLAPSATENDGDVPFENSMNLEAGSREFALEEATTSSTEILDTPGSDKAEDSLLCNDVASKDDHRTGDNDTEKPKSTDTENTSGEAKGSRMIIASESCNEIDRMLSEKDDVSTENVIQDANSKVDASSSRTWTNKSPTLPDSNADPVRDVMPAEKDEDTTGPKNGTYRSILKKRAEKTAMRSGNSAVRKTRVVGVAFDTVQVRHYSMELGDHPSCSIGPPVSLSWECVHEDNPRAIDAYESARRFRRKKNPGLLNYYQRRDILKEAGYTDEQLDTADRERKKIQRQRHGTKMLLPFSKVEETWQSARRKAQRVLRRRRQGARVCQDIQRSESFSPSFIDTKKKSHKFVSSQSL
ncbi:hypothetical protein ACA910_015430 [Epithemia clementina (nom. ined.)]